MRPTLAALLLVLASASSSEAIVIRHDRDDADYLARAGDYPMVCRAGGGMGTLVAPDWLLTAAHVAESVGKGTVRCDDREVAVAELFLHPDYAGEAHRDIALLRLEAPFEGLPTARLYREKDELGKRIQFVGDGYSGTGKSGPTERQRRRRVADNTVAAVRPGWIVFDFDAPPAGDPLEGISGPGDSGGPALLTIDGVHHVLGVSAYNEGDELCRYGTREHYARVSDELEWLEGVIGGSIAADATPRLMRYESDESGQTVATRIEIEPVALPEGADARLQQVVDRLALAMNDPKGDALGLFAARYLREQEERGDPVTGMLDFLRAAIEARGPIARFHDLPTEGMRLPDSPHPMRPVVFHLADGSPGYFGLALDAQGKIDHLSLFLQPGICAERERCSEGRLFEGEKK